MIVPVSSGNVIVLSAVGSVTVNVVSKSLAVEPSKVIPPVNVGTASNVNALPVADDVNLGILESSSTDNKPVWVSKAFALKVSLIFNLVELTYFEVMLIHFVFRYFFLWRKPTTLNTGNFESLPMKDFFNKIK